MYIELRGGTGLQKGKLWS